MWNRLFESVFFHWRRKKVLYARNMDDYIYTVNFLSFQLFLCENIKCDESLKHSHIFCYDEHKMVIKYTINWTNQPNYKNCSEHYWMNKINICVLILCQFYCVLEIFFTFTAQSTGYSPLKFMENLHEILTIMSLFNLLKYFYGDKVEKYIMIIHKLKCIHCFYQKIAIIIRTGSKRCLSKYNLTGTKNPHSIIATTEIVLASTKYRFILTFIYNPFN